MSHCILTGAAGFVGSHVLRHLLVNTDWTIACPVSFRHMGLPLRISLALADLDWTDRVAVVQCDLASPLDHLTMRALGSDRCTVVMNIASESHVDRSIAEPRPFILNNVQLMLTMLEAARDMPQLGLFLHMGTDEEYGPAYGDYKHTEWDTVLPSNPYSSSKAAQTGFAVSWWRTERIPVVLTRTMNLIGPTTPQSAEKYIPKTLRAILNDEIVTVHASPEGVSGSRHWIDARDFADAWLFLSDHKPARYPDATRPDMFHIVGTEATNLEIAQMVAAAAGRELRYELTSFHSSRPGHDLRYALDGSKLAHAGWRVTRPLEETVRDIVDQFMAHPEWLTA